MNYQPADRHPGVLRIERLASLADLQAIHVEWQELTRGAPVAQQPAYVEAAWLNGLCTGDLRVLLAYQDDRLVAVWPLYASRKMGRTIVRHIGNGGREEYAGPFLAAYVQPEPVLSALWDAIRREGDLLELYNLAEDSAAHRFFNQISSSDRLTSTIVCPFMRTRDTAWDKWLAAKSRNFREDLKRKRKRLVSTGQAEFRRIPAADAVKYAKWCVEMKRLWLDAHGIAESWLRADEIISFYADLMDRDVGIEGFALELDGQPIAGVICLLGGGVCEYYLTVYDERWKDSSPGYLLIEDLAKWCAARNLDLDFRFPSYDYKERWADERRSVYTISLALSPGGRLMLGGRRAKALVRRLRSGLKKIVKLMASKARFSSSSKPRQAHGQGHT